MQEWGRTIENSVQNASDCVGDFFEQVVAGMGDVVEGIDQYRKEQNNSAIPGIPSLGSVGGNEVVDVIETIRFVANFQQEWRNGGVRERTALLTQGIMLSTGLIIGYKGIRARAKTVTAPIDNATNSHLLKTEGVKVWQDAESERYLKSQSAEAAYMSNVDGEGTLIFKTTAGRPEILEELIHHNQKLKFGEEYFLDNRTRLEIETQDKLLEIGKKENWSVEEMKKIESAKLAWIKKYNEEAKARQISSQGN